MPSGRLLADSTKSRASPGPALQPVCPTLSRAHGEPGPQAGVVGTASTVPHIPAALGTPRHLDLRPRGQHCGLIAGSCPMHLTSRMAHRLWTAMFYVKHQHIKQAKQKKKRKEKKKKKRGNKTQKLQIHHFLAPWQNLGGTLGFRRAQFEKHQCKPHTGQHDQPGQAP